MANPVRWFEIGAKDQGRAQAFYSELFGWKVDTNNPMKYAMIDTGTKDGIQGGIAPNTAQQPHPGVTFYVEVVDPKATLARAEKLGAKVVLPVTEVPGGPTLALFADAEGHVIGLVKAM
jgi:predicted enzyme related to lactoylglutathione lyase